MIIILIVLLLIISIIDIKTKTIDTRLNILILIVGLFNNIQVKEILLCLLLPITLIILNKLSHKEVVGYGDIELLFCLSFSLGYKLQVISFFLAILFLCVYSIFKKDEKVPFAPFISVGTLVSLLVIYLY